MRIITLITIGLSLFFQCLSQSHPLDSPKLKKEILQDTSQQDSSFYELMRDLAFSPGAKELGMENSS